MLKKGPWESLEQLSHKISEKREKGRRGDLGGLAIRRKGTYHAKKRTSARGNNRKEGGARKNIKKTIRDRPTDHRRRLQPFLRKVEPSNQEKKRTELK